MINLQEYKKSNTELLKVLPNLPDKMIVDFANGIDVAKDHVRVKRSRGRFVDRFCDSITGKNHQRQNEINMCLIDGLEGSLRWLTEVTESLSLTNIAIIKAHEGIKKIAIQQSEIIDFSIETRNSLNKLEELLQDKVHELEKEIKRVDFEQKAKRQMDFVFDKWKALKFNDFSIAGKAVAVLEELRWGDFGYFIKNISKEKTYFQFMENLKNKLTIQIREDVGYNGIYETEMLMKPSRNNSDLIDALAYLSNWSNISTPIVFSATQFPERSPENLPKIYSPEMMSKHAIKEVFEGDII